MLIITLSIPLHKIVVHCMYLLESYMYKPVESKLCAVVISFDDLLGCTLLWFSGSIVIQYMH